MTNCSVCGCKKRSETSNLKKDNTSFHRFPKNLLQRTAWIQACKNHVNWVPKRTSTICSAHFDHDCYNISEKKRKLKETAIPTLQLPDVISSGDSEPEVSKPKKMKYSTSDDPPTLLTINFDATGTYYQQPSTSNSEHNPNSRNTSQITKSLQDSPRKKKLKRQLHLKNLKIKRLQSQRRYLKKKVARLEDILKALTEKSLIGKEERLVLEKIGVTVSS